MIPRYPIGKSMPLPQRGSWPATVHVFDEASAHALRAAEAAGRPLLIRGEPGAGKSQLARAAAEVSRPKRLFLAVVVNARAESQDLQWQFDAVARLGEAQALAHCPADEIPGRLQPRRFLTPGPLWWAFDWPSALKQYEEDCDHPLESMPAIPEGWEPRHGSVLLIDEIDKADADLPNGLLETLGNGDFTVPYLGQSVRQSKDNPPPLVIITTNEERELPAAFLRRCLVLPLALPQDGAALLDFLCERGQVHSPASTEAVRRKAGEQLLEDRKAAIAQGLPAPGQAEYLDLLRAVCRLSQDEKEQLSLLEKISGFVLQKAPIKPY